MLKIMAFALPKLTKFCRGKEDRKKMMLKITTVLPYIERREPYVRAIKEMLAIIDE